MSKHHHSIIAAAIAFTVSEIAKSSADEIEKLYGIQLSEDGTVFDTTYNKTFESVSDWAEFNIEQDDLEYEEHF